MTLDDEFDSYDPIIAERFSVLDRATMPRRHTAPSAAAEEPAVAIRGGGKRPWYHLAAAAAFAVVAGASVVAIAQRGQQQDVEATTGGDVSIEADRAADDEAEKRSLTVEVPSTGAAAAETAESGDGSRDPSPTGDDATGDGPADEAASATTTTTRRSEQSTGNDAGSAIERTTGSTEAPEPPATQTTRPASTAEASPTSAEATPRTTTTRDMTPGSSWLNPPAPEKMITITGVVTEVFTDCMSRMILNGAGKVEIITPVSCDGGSYIIVDGMRIQTTSGFTEPDDHFGKHPTWLRPGHTVRVTAIPTGAGGRLLTLDCVQCLVELG